MGVIASVCCLLQRNSTRRHEWTEPGKAIRFGGPVSHLRTGHRSQPHILAAVHSFILQPVKQMSTFWRAAKLSYLEYVNHSSSAVRAALKEPLRSKAAVRGKVHLRERWYEGGVPGESKYFFVSLNDALHYMLQKAMPGGPSMLDFVLT